jgi:D-alanine-D-alanine ligase
MFDSIVINTPEWIVLTKDDDPEDVFASLQLPLVFKPVRGGSSQGVTLLKDKEGVKEAFSTALNYDSTGRVMIEKLIDGRELTVGILDDEALPVIELKTPLEFYNYEAKYEAETTEYICPAPLDEDVEQKVKNIALEAFHSLSCHHFARADIMLDKNNIPYVLEVNTIPGFTSHSLLPKAAATAGIDFPSLCLKIIELAKKG